jgi:hypothetical protein
MGATPCTESITVEFGCQIRVELKDGSLESILKAFCKILPEILRDFIQKIVSMFGWTVDKMTIGKSVQKTAAEIDFQLDEKGLPLGEADGTGVGIKGIAKRGKELKVFVQYKRGGGVRVAGLDIGNYNGSWDKLFGKSIKVFRKFSRFLLITDGDTSILDSLKGKVKVLVQRCLWHIPYQQSMYYGKMGSRARGKNGWR